MWVTQTEFTSIRPWYQLNSNDSHGGGGTENLFLKMEQICVSGNSSRPIRVGVDITQCRRGGGGGISWPFLFPITGNLTFQYNTDSTTWGWGACETNQLPSRLERRWSLKWTYDHCEWTWQFHNKCPFVLRLTAGLSPRSNRKGSSVENRWRTIPDLPLEWVAFFTSFHYILIEDALNVII